MKDPDFDSDGRFRPIISDKAIVALTNTLKFISACVLAGLICWIQPEVIGWACLVVVVVVLLIVNPF